LPSARHPSSTGVGAGICGACADACHRVLSHKVVCIGHKSMHTCDCGRLDKLACACLRTSLHHACSAASASKASVPTASSSKAKTDSASSTSSAAPSSGSGVSCIGWFEPLPPCTNRYNHNFDTPPSYCYVRRAPTAVTSNKSSNSSSGSSGDAAADGKEVEVEGGCRFDNSGDADVVVTLPVIVNGEEDIERFSAAAVVQCTSCEDWFHPRYLHILVDSPP
jgi:hypothetical protein